MKKLTKEELLKNPLVKEIAFEFAEHTSLRDDEAWDDFTKTQTKKEWEILAYKWKDTEEILEGERLEKALKAGGCVHEGYSIFKVKRLSDGVIFTVGDKVKCPNGEIQPIEYFVSAGNEYKWVGVVNKFKAGGPHDINKLVKVEKLFTTEDGVDMYEGDEYWEAFNGSFANTWVVYETPTKVRGDIKYAQENNKKYGRLWFSTRKAAEEYILMNKPCLSLIDVASTYGERTPSWELLKKLVRSKLK